MSAKCRPVKVEPASSSAGGLGREQEKKLPMTAFSCLKKLARLLV